MRRLPVLVAVVVVVVLLEGVLVGAITFSRGARESVSDAWYRAVDVVVGTEGEPGAMDRVGSAFSSTYRRGLQPLFSAPRHDPDPGGFSACLECHPDYAERRRYSSVYMNHPLHAQIGVECGRCHVDTSHPAPLTPREHTCAVCHAEVSQESACDTCHVPGSLAHYHQLGSPRSGSVECAACHLADSVTGSDDELIVDPGFRGRQPGDCLECHESATCAGCHGESHPDGWRSVHGASVSSAGAGDCAGCHTISFCADACHADRPTNPTGHRPLPIGGSSP